MSEQQGHKPHVHEACPCGSGKTYGQCCGANEPCPCGSGTAYSECCGANAKDAK
jgi:uncharacterized protein YecA (UPF0149 family)